jgi:hypothetical protein
LIGHYDRKLFAVAALEAALVVAFFACYLASFEPTSSVHGPYEVFAQDSVYILKYLEEGKPYRWNPQSHLLYHWAVEHGHAIWQRLLGPGASTYAYLKLFTGLCGAAFLGLMLWLFRELGLDPARRAVLLLLTGVSVSAWFHFAAFETHALALPGLVAYTIALVRLRDRPERGAVDRLLLIAGLLLCGWTRIDLFRFAAVSTLLAVVPGTGRHRRGVLAELALTAVLGAAGNAWLAHDYLGAPLGEAAVAALERDDRRDLRERMARFENLESDRLVTVGRAVTLYSLIMPVEPRPPERSFWAPPIQRIELVYSGRGTYPSTGLFLEPARNLLHRGLSLVALAAAGALLVGAFASSARRAASGDAFHAMLLAQALAGWLLYTWFNPFEPFLWVAEFLPLWIAMVADGWRRQGLAATVAIGFAALVVALHNIFAFYVSFR